MFPERAAKTVVLMAPQQKEKNLVIQWCKALILSPGMLFCAGYLLLYLCTAHSLRVHFKDDLLQSFSQATGNSRQIRFASLKTDFFLDTITLTKIELSPSGRAKTGSQPIIINTIKINLPDLDTFLFCPATRQSSSKVVCEEILKEERRLQ